MGLLNNLDEATNKKKLLNALEVNPTEVIIEKVVSPTSALINGQLTILAGTNNYLGLTFNRKCVEAGKKALEESGTGTTGSRMANGTYSTHLELEKELAELFEMRSAMVFSTGYGANLGTLSALLRPSDAVLIDSEAHASLFDGCRMSGAEVFRFLHNDPKSLEKRLVRLGSRAKNTLIIAEGLYSIRGDCAPLKDFVEIKNKFGAYLMVDEAHSLGLYGKMGRGLADQLGVLQQTDFLVGTFSKSLGSIGGFCVSNHEEVSSIRYASRPFIFTASPCPSVVASTREAIIAMREGDDLRRRAWEGASNLYHSLQKLGFPLGPELSPVIGVTFDDERSAFHFWQLLLDSGVYTNLILPPAAPGGGAVIRCSITAGHSKDQINRISSAFKEAQAKLAIL